MKPDTDDGVNDDNYVDLDPVRVEDRALEIARTEGRYEANELDREDSLHELREPLLEDELAQEQIDENDRPDSGVAPTSYGHKVERVPLEDEINIVEELVQEGVDGADLDTRTHSGSNREL